MGGMARKRGLALLIVLAAAALPAAAAARGRAPVAALQVALRAHRLYGGDVDGYAGPVTRSAVRRFQARAHLAVDGIAGPRTRRALGRLGWHSYGSRMLATGRVGWDVSALQFLLAWHGFPNGTVDGGFGAHVRAAVVRFQQWAGLGVDGVAGPATFRALGTPIPGVGVALRRPVPYAVGDGFGPRGNTFHPGLDFLAPYGAAVHAARGGRVSFAGYDSGGYGNLVVVSDGRGLTEWYGHLSRIGVGPGARVSSGSYLGRVGATGLATGPHLHFEVRRHGAAVNPLPALG
jgi:peptidoglycan hydrolase-like protein with peptidoglycan-binding domain